MKTINYTGSSKIIKRIVHLLNRKAPLPLDGDGDAVWGTNGQVLTTDGQGNTSWTTPQGGGGDVTDVEVNGTSVVNAQGVAEVSVPTATSDLNNDSGFITNLVNDLANYYTKSQTYTQAEVNALISGIVTLNILVVQALPTQDISTTTIYLVPKQDTGTSDIYDEYLYINNAWELIGTTQIDLSNYVTTTDLSTALADYVTSVGLATILAGYVQSSDLAAVATSGSYNDLSNKPTIPAAQIQSDWNQSDTTAKDYIKNKPTIPTALSDLTDDATHRTVTDSDITAWNGKVGKKTTLDTYYGACPTAAATAAKVITVTDTESNFSLRAGVVICVKFTYTNTANEPTFNVNNTGAKSVWYNTALITTGSLGFGGTANRPMQFTYDGTQWVFTGWSYNQSYSNMSASELTTGTATTARSISAKVLTDWNTAANTTYDPTTSGLSATRVQGAIDEAVEKLATHRLWTNPNVVSAFVGQTVQLNDDISNYAYVEIVYRRYYGTPSYTSTGKCAPGLLQLSSIANNLLYYRDITAMSGTSCTFDDGHRLDSYGASASVYNNGLIPVYILGYKPLQ